MLEFVMIFYVVALYLCLNWLILYVLSRYTDVSEVYELSILHVLISISLIFIMITWSFCVFLV